jgi:hypothetical protein
MSASIKLCRNWRLRFRLRVPRRFKKVSIFDKIRILNRFGNAPAGWTLVGSNNEWLRVAAGPIFPEPSVITQTAELRRIASKRGEKIESTAAIEVGGRHHATMTVQMSDGTIMHHYSIIFKGFEYLFSACGDRVIIDPIIESFKKGLF